MTWWVIARVKDCGDRGVFENGKEAESVLRVNDVCVSLMRA